MNFINQELSFCIFYIIIVFINHRSQNIGTYKFYIFYIFIYIHLFHLHANISNILSYAPVFIFPDILF